MLVSLKTSHNAFFVFQTPFKCLPCFADEDSLGEVSHFESANKAKHFPLKKPAGAILRKAGLEDTVYKDYTADVNGWDNFYLPKTVNMQVVAMVEGISCPCDQLILMTFEDQQVYAYDEEELHLVASSFKQLFDEGMEYPASKTYYKGEAFKNIADEVKKRNIHIYRDINTELNTQKSMKNRNFSII
uniref:Uncharacterized protein n=1 Tax=Pundamilia nyererei TaxID=303518 RepID=A0A3B4GEL9_9CICH